MGGRTLATTFQECLQSTMTPPLHSLIIELSFEVNYCINNKEGSTVGEI